MQNLEPYLPVGSYRQNIDNYLSWLREYHNDLVDSFFLLQESNGFLLGNIINSKDCRWLENLLYLLQKQYEAGYYQAQNKYVEKVHHTEKARYDLGFKDATSNHQKMFNRLLSGENSEAQEAVQTLIRLGFLNDKAEISRYYH